MTSTFTSRVRARPPVARSTELERIEKGEGSREPSPWTRFLIPIALIYALSLRNLYWFASYHAVDGLTRWLEARGFNGDDAYFYVHFSHAILDNLFRIALVVIGLRCLSMKEEDIGWRRPSRFGFLAWAPMLAALSQLAQHVLRALPDAWFLQRMPHSVSVHIDPDWFLTANPTVYNHFLTPVLLIPIVEELLYRGLIQTSLQKYIGRWASLFAASLLFAAAHDFHGAWSFASYFVSGLLYGGIRIWTGSLGAPVLVHLIENLLCWCSGPA